MNCAEIVLYIGVIIYTVIVTVFFIVKYRRRKK